MRRLIATATALTACATTLLIGSPATAADGGVADLTAFRLPSTADSQCLIGIRNNGPDTAFAIVLPSNFLFKGYQRSVGMLAAGQSTVVDYKTCEAPSYDPTLSVIVSISGSQKDPNPLNNIVPFAIPAPSA